MTLRDEKLFRFMPFDSTQRVTGKDYTPEALERQRQDFLRRGGKVTIVPEGFMKTGAPIPLRNKNYRGPEIELDGPKARRLAED